MKSVTSRTVPQTEHESYSRSERYLRNLQRYMADGQKGDILYSYQKNIVSDTAKFLGSGDRRGYIEAPTGTGKTVLFVTLAEAFGYQDASPPKILVVTPTKDLVRQTQGGTRNDKGFAGFAPDLSVGTFYSDTPAGLRGLDAQVTITTYASLAKLAAMPITISHDDGTRRTKITNQVNERFDVIFLDEGHKALGTSSRRIIEDIDEHTLIIGFTATPDYNTTRSLATLLPHLIHRLDLKEAIMLDMLSPVIPLAIPAPATSAQDFVVGALGDYENKSLKQLIYNSSRNQMISDIAARVIQAGNTPIIACIPGDNTAHPYRIADQLSEQSITLQDGSMRAIRAVAVTSAIPAVTRQKLYAQLEAGEIDALTYIDVLTEGWDSQRANVIINARPTRSLVAARQRMGRILRSKADSRPAIAIDIVDRVSSTTAPQVSMADIFTLEEIVSGASVGTIATSHEMAVKQLTQQLTDAHGSIERVKNLYTEYAALLETLPQLARGQAQIKQDGKVRTFASAGRLFSRFDIDEFMLEHLKKHDIDIRMVRSKYEAVEAYDEQQIHQLLAELPDSGPRGHGAVVDGVKYVSLHDLLGVLRRKYEDPTLDYRDLVALARYSEVSSNDFLFTKRFRARTHRGVALYTAQTMLKLSAGQTIASNYGKI
ncbi:MAG: DEAD/DEAH box helicase family protein [Candidatus Saccharimonadales bacterium]